MQSVILSAAKNPEGDCDIYQTVIIWILRCAQNDSS